MPTVAALALPSLVMMRIELAIVLQILLREDHDRLQTCVVVAVRPSRRHRREQQQPGFGERFTEYAVPLPNPEISSSARHLIVATTAPVQTVRKIRPIPARRCPGAREAVTAGTRRHRSMSHAAIAEPSLLHIRSRFLARKSESGATVKVAQTQDRASPPSVKQIATSSITGYGVPSREETCFRRSCCHHHAPSIRSQRRVQSRATPRATSLQTPVDAAGMARTRWDGWYRDTTHARNIHEYTRPDGAAMRCAFAPPITEFRAPSEDLPVTPPIFTLTKGRRHPRTR